MGNSSTKVERQQQPASDYRQVSPRTQQSSPPSSSSRVESGQNEIYGRRQRGNSHSELLTIFGVGNGNGNGVDRDSAGLENRRESKAEREARKLEKERAVRAMDRERSMRDENVDGGYLVTQGVYTGTEDFSKVMVRHLMIERRIAPFWRGLNDHSDSWTENQLVAAARGLPIPAPDEIPFESPTRPFPGNAGRDTQAGHLTIPIISRADSYASDSSGGVQPAISSYPSPSQTSGSTLLRGRAKTLVSLSTASKPSSDTFLTPREVQLPKDDFVNGQRIEAHLYKDAVECPICFIYYPPYLNKTRCCDQPVCSECFVQIKRPDPHPPEHVDPAAPPPIPSEENGYNVDVNLVSEPAQCPYCAQPEFGVTYDSPAFRRGLAYPSHQPSNSPPASSSSSLTNGLSGSVGRRRAASLPATAATVVTTDRVRPDWVVKLATARALAARRSAAATALHTAAYMMGGRNDSRPFAFGRRLRRSSGGEEPSIEGTSPLDVLAVLTGRNILEQEGAQSAIGQRQSSRRNRVDDIEDMMMMEAIRLSLATEEERRKREDKESKKEAKKKIKDDKKADKAAKKSGMYSPYANQSSGTLDNSSSTNISIENGKGKASTRSGIPIYQYAGQSPSASASSLTENPQSYLERSRAQILPADGASTSYPGGYKPSHLRNLSNASSCASSFAETGTTNDHGLSSGSMGLTHQLLPEDAMSATPPGGGAGLEPMFNFRSLAAMIDNESKASSASHFENDDAEHDVGESSRNNSDSKTHGGPAMGMWKPDAGGVGTDSKHHEVRIENRQPFREIGDA